MPILLILLSKSFTMLDILVKLHSFVRWALLILLLACIIKSLQGMMSKKAFGASDNKISLFLMISAHTQLLIGLVMYFISPMVSFNLSSVSDPEIHKQMHF